MHNTMWLKLVHSCVTASPIRIVDAPMPHKITTLFSKPPEERVLVLEKLTTLKSDREDSNASKTGKIYKVTDLN